MARAIIGVLLALCAGVAAHAADNSGIEGTYRLISSTRTIVATGQVEDAFGSDPIGYITYGKDHRMTVLIVKRDRPKPTFKTLNDAQKISLFDSMAAYCGTYTFDGKTVLHTIDASWNEILTGTTQMRSVKKEGRRLIYTTTASPAPTDGQISTSTLIWEKVGDT